MSQLKYCQGPRCHTHDTKDRKRGPKTIREVKQEEDQASIILMVTVAQCNVCMNGSMSMAHEPWTTSAE